MIRVVVPNEDEFGHELEQRLKGLCVAFKKEHLPDEDYGSKTTVTVIDGRHCFSGRQEIDEWLRKLEDELTFQRSISSDACYVNPASGELC